MCSSMRVPWLPLACRGQGLACQVSWAQCLPKHHSRQSLNNKPQGAAACLQTYNQGLEWSVSLRRTGRGPVLACAKRGGGGQGALSPQSPVRTSPWVALPLAAWSPPGGPGLRWPSGRARTRRQGGWLSPGRATPERPRSAL